MDSDIAAATAKALRITFSIRTIGKCVKALLIHREFNLLSQRASLFGRSSMMFNVIMVNGGAAPRRSGIALAGDRTYLRQEIFGIEDMPALASPLATIRPLLLVGLVAGVLIAATVALWVYYGTAMFFELIRTGWMACF